MKKRVGLGLIAMSGVTLGLLTISGAAQAGDIDFSVGVGVPVEPTYIAPAYGAPVYAAPPPVVYRGWGGDDGDDGDDYRHWRHEWRERHHEWREHHRHHDDDD